MSTSEVDIVFAWHEALNAGDVDRLVALSSEDVEVGGPRGTGMGAHLLREWFGRAGVHLEPRRTYRRGDTVVVEQDAAWHNHVTDETSESQVVASVFVVRDGRVASVLRHPDLAAAIAAAGLNEADGVAEAASNGRMQE